MPTYYYLDADKQQHGPVSEEELCDTVLTPELLVWTEGLDKWTPARDIPILQYRLSGEPMPPSAPPMPELPEQPKTFLALSIVATVLCFPFGIAALLLSTKVTELYWKGMYEEAEEKSRRARNLSIIGIVVGVIFNIVYLIFCLATMDTPTLPVEEYYYYY